MTRILTVSVSLAALAALSACGRDGADEAANPATDETVQVAVVEPEAAQPETSDTPDTPAPDTASRPLTRDLGSEYLNADVTVPAEAAADPALYDRLMDAARAEADEARDIAAEDATMREQDDIPFNAHELGIEWSATFANDDVLSLLKTTYVFQGGAHPNSYFDALTWRRDTHAPLTIQDLFTDEAWAALSPLAENAVMEQKRERLGDGLSDEEYWREDVIYATAPAAENFELFTLVPSASDPAKAGGIALHYAPYTFGAYVEGDYHIVIPQAAFADYVAPEYAGLFAGEPAQR